MRRKLLFTYLTLTTVLLLALEIPLALSFAMNEFHHLAIARLNDTARFATLAVPVLRGDTPPDGLRAQLAEFDRANDVGVLVVDKAGQVVLASRRGIVVDGEGRQESLRRALAGQREDALDYPYNLRARPLFLAEPVESGAQVLGAAVTVSPTTAVRDSAVGRAAVLAVIGLLSLTAAAAAAVPFTRWILRPVQELDDAARSIAGGDYGKRAQLDHGPPEIRGLAETFDTMADRLLTLLETQRAFVADASHQMRNPLTALRLRIETLEPVVTQDGREQLDVTIAEAERLSKILDELLRLAQADAAPSSATAVFDVREVVGQRAAAWQAKADAAGVAIEVAGTAPTVRSAAGTVDQALDVLIDNALHVSPPRGRVRIMIEQVDHRVRVHVVDQGPGMSAEDRARACDRFWRGSSSAGRDGSGLGLSIARTLLVASGGDLQLDAASPHGLDAVMSLPVAATASAAS